MSNITGHDADFHERYELRTGETCPVCRPWETPDDSPCLCGAYDHQNMECLEITEEGK